MKRITSVLLAVLMILGLCACEKPVQNVPSVASEITESTTGVSVSVSEVSEETDEYAGLSEDARMIAEFTGVVPEEFEDIRDIDYYTAYVESMYDIPHWKAFGTAAMICGYEPTKTQEKVVNYLNGRAPRGFDYLFEAFFNKKYASEDVIECAKSYACYLTKATLENHSYAEYLQNDYREEWYKAVGCTREYDYDEYDRLIENGKSTPKDENVIEFKVGKHMWVYGGETWVNNAQELYKLIHDGQESFDVMEEAVKADAPHFFETYDKYSYAIVQLVDDDNWSLTRKTNYGGWITLSFSSAAPHEYVHALTVRASSNGADVRWVCEGIADYYSNKYNKGTGNGSAYWTSFLKGDVPEDFWEGEDPAWRERMEPLMIECRDTFNAYKEMYGDEYSEDLYAFLALAEKEIEKDVVMATYTVSGAYSADGIKRGGKTTIDTVISYPGACVLAKEMIKDFGAEKVLTYLYVGGDFKLEFGMTSMEYFEMVRERGGYKLGYFDDTPYNND